MTPGATLDTMNVIFEDIKLVRATTLLKNAPVHLIIVIQRGDGRFQVTENNTTVVSGIVKGMRLPEPVTQLKIPASSSSEPTPILTSHEFYKELRLRGYMYEGDFCCVQSVRSDGRCGQVEWKNDNWPAFMDAMLQVSILLNDSRSLQLPTGIRHIKINAADHSNYLKTLQASAGDADGIVCEVRTSPELNTIVCGGIEITGLTSNTVSRRQQNGVKVLDRYEFVPLNGDGLVHTMNDAVRICTQLIHEILQTKQIRIVEVLDRDCADIEMPQSQPIIENFQQALLRMPMLNAELMLMTQRSFPDLSEIEIRSNSKLPTSGDSAVIIASNCRSDRDFSAAASKNLIDNGFLISIETNEIKWTGLTAPEGFKLISIVRTESIALVVMQRDPIETLRKTENVTIHLQSGDKDFKWLKSVQEAFAAPATALTLVVQGDTRSGALGFVNCLRREKQDRQIQLVQIEEKGIPYADQLLLGLPINIRRNGCWGTYRHLNILSSRTEGDVREQSLRMNIQKFGDLSTFVWQPASTAANHIKVHYGALNFRDVMLASGRLSVDAFSSNRREQENVVGVEFAGVSTSGERVMGVCGGGAIATRINFNEPKLMWKVPDHMTLREASTIPAVYATVYFGFFVKNEITAGQSILIHAGTGGVGLAAIHVAFAYGLRVFTTVSSQQKRDFLLREFVQLKGRRQILSFQKQINITFSLV